jgi:nucleotide-binding universal stress UspA family protein
MNTNDFQLKRILVPVDFSACTINTLQYAATLADKFNAIVTVLHVVQLSIAGEERGVPRTRYIGELRKNGEGQLRKILEFAWNGDIITKIVVRDGRPAEEILKEAESGNSDVIVMGTHGLVGFRRWLHRNTVARIIRHAPCPVLVVGALTGNFHSDSRRRSATLMS